MENLRNKTQNYVRAKNKKDYFKRFTNLNVYSYTKDKKIYIGAKPEEVYSLFNGNTSSIKKALLCEGQSMEQSSKDITIDQSTIQYYMILGLQDFYYNYHLPLVEQLNMMKKKNDERYDILTKNLEVLCKHVNKKKA